MSPVRLVKAEFGPTQEEIINRCGRVEGNAECELTETITEEGAEVRDVNCKSFSRNLWKRKRVYSCFGRGEGDTACGPLESGPTCILQCKTCLAEPDGVCTNREHHYRCGVAPGDLETSCVPINVCVGDNCNGVEQETSDEFGRSAAWLNVLAQKTWRRPSALPQLLRQGAHFEKGISSEDDQASSCSCGPGGAARVHENTSRTSAKIMGLQSMTGVQRAAQAQPSEQDPAMSRDEVQTELSTLYARSEALNKAERKRERKANLTGGLMKAGLSVFDAGAIAASGVRGSGGPDA